MELIPIVSDLQAPYHDRRAVGAVVSFIEEYDFKKVLCVGDVLDAPQVSQWTKGRAGEHAGDLAKDRDVAVKLLADLRVTDLSRSNHDDRVEKYVAKYAPGFAGLPELTIERFMGLDDLGITFHRKPARVAPGWYMLHGDEVGYSRTAGGTALGLARKVGGSVVCGHTHKLGLQHDHSSVSGRRTASRWGLEVGNLMDQKRAGYLGAGYANWQQGFGVLLVDGSNVTPIPVPISNGSFWFEGVKFSG
jgi:hypothetical protein